MTEFKLAIGIEKSSVPLGDRRSGNTDDTLVFAISPAVQDSELLRVMRDKVSFQGNMQVETIQHTEYTEFAIASQDKYGERMRAVALGGIQSILRRRRHIVHANLEPVALTDERSVFEHLADRKKRREPALVS